MDHIQVVIWNDLKDAERLMVRGADIHVEGRLRTIGYSKVESNRLIQECDVWVYCWQVGSERFGKYRAEPE
jgi:hypothetical protein